MKKEVITNKSIKDLQHSLRCGLIQYNKNYKQSSKFLDITNININHINVSRREISDSKNTSIGIDVVLCEENLTYQQMTFDKTYTKLVSVLTTTLKNDNILITANIFLCLKECQDPDVIYIPFEDCYIKDVFKICRKTFFKWVEDLNISMYNGHCPRCGHTRFDANYVTKAKVEYNKDTESFEEVLVIYEPKTANGNEEPDMIKCENCGCTIKRMMEE